MGGHKRTIISKGRPPQVKVEGSPNRPRIIVHRAHSKRPIVLYLSEIRSRRRDLVKKCSVIYLEDGTEEHVYQTLEDIDALIIEAKQSWSDKRRYRYGSPSDW